MLTTITADDEEHGDVDAGSATAYKPRKERLQNLRFKV
jgi:hypothetical protein